MSCVHLKLAVCAWNFRLLVSAPWNYRYLSELISLPELVVEVYSGWSAGIFLFSPHTWHTRTLQVGHLPNFSPYRAFLFYNIAMFKIIPRKCRGAAGKPFLHDLHRLLKRRSSDLILIVETRLSYDIASIISNCLPGFRVTQILSDGKSGRILARYQINFKL